MLLNFFWWEILKSELEVAEVLSLTDHLAMERIQIQLTHKNIILAIFKNLELIKGVNFMYNFFSFLEAHWA